MKKGTWFLIITVTVVVGTTAFLLYRQSKKMSVPSDDDYRKLMDASANSGMNIFLGMTLDQVKEKIKSATSADVKKLTELISKVKDEESQEAADFMELLNKVS